MDKKNTAIGLLLLARRIRPDVLQAPPPSQPAETPVTTPTQSPSQNTPSNPSEAIPVIAPQANLNVSGPAELESIGANLDERIVTRDNALMEARFTNYGGAIQEIVLKDFERSRTDNSPYIMNERRSGPALELTGLQGLDKSESYQLVEPSDPNTVEFRKVINDNYQITRRYTISQDVENEKAYLVRHELEFRNLTANPLFIGEFNLNSGTVAPSGPQDAPNF